MGAGSQLIRNIFVEKKIINSKFIYSILVGLILFIPVFVDLLNGFLLSKNISGISLGIIYRTGLFLITIPFILLIREKIIYLFILVFTCLFVCSNIIWLLNSNYYNPPTEIQNFVKIILPYSLLSCLLFVNAKYRQDIRKYMGHIINFGFVAGIAIIFSFLTGLGLESYDEWSFGVKSYFIAINDISLAMLLAYIMNLFSLFEKFTYIKIIKSLCMICGLVLLTSRTGILGALGSSFVFFAAILFYGKKSIPIAFSKKMLIFMIFFILFIIGIVFLINIILKYPYLVKKMDSLMEHSPRALLIPIAQDRIDTRSWFFNVFGEGFSSFSKFVEQRYSFGISLWTKTDSGKLIEQDYYDIIGAFGYLTGSIILLFPVVLFFKMLFVFISNRSFLNFTFLFLITVFIGHSYLAGHALMSPTVATIIVVVYFYIITQHLYKSQKPQCQIVSEMG